MQRSQIFIHNRVFCLPHLHSTPPLGGFPSEYRHPVWYGKTRMVWLPDGEKISKIRFIRFDTTHERDRQTHTDTQTPHGGIGRAYASHRAEKKENALAGLPLPGLLRMAEPVWSTRLQTFLTVLNVYPLSW